MSIVLPPINALGTTWTIEIFDSLGAKTVNETVQIIHHFLSEFEDRYSRFKADSIISMINSTGRFDCLDPTTLNILRLGQQFYQDTNGIFNILIGAHLNARGYDINYRLTPQIEPTDFPSPQSDLIITDTAIQLKNGQIDLGGYGKGYLIDQLTSHLRHNGFQHFLINGGGDIYATSDFGKPITVYLEHPTIPGTYIAETTLKEQGFAASSTHRRRWKIAGQEYSHLVKTTAHLNKNDPDSSDQNPDEIGIYVKAPTAVMADVWSTTLLISHPERHRESIAGSSVTYTLFNTVSNTIEQSPKF